MNQQEYSTEAVKRKEMLHFHDVCDAWLRTVFTPWGLNLKLHSSNAQCVWSLLNAVMKWEKSPGTPFQSPQSLVWHGNKRKLYYTESRSSSGHIKKTTKGNYGASPKAKSLPHTHFLFPQEREQAAVLHCSAGSVIYHLLLLLLLLLAFPISLGSVVFKRVSQLILCCTQHLSAWIVLLFFVISGHFGSSPDPRNGKSL